jgi:hypothetical protein
MEGIERQRGGPGTASLVPHGLGEPPDVPRLMRESYAFLA